MIRLEESLVLLGSMEEESRIVASESLFSEMEANFGLELTVEELNVLFFWKNFSTSELFFDLVKELLGKLHLTGVVKFPSIDQKFLSESNATSMINNSMLNLANRLIVIEGIDNGQRFNVSPEGLQLGFPEFSNYLTNLKEHLSSDGPFPESGLLLEDIIESEDENASFSAQQY